MANSGYFVPKMQNQIDNQLILAVKSGQYGTYSNKSCYTY